MEGSSLSIIPNGTVYGAFGLTISSEIPLPELLTNHQHEGPVDAEVILDEMSAYKPILLDNPNTYMVLDKQVLFYIPDNAFYGIKDGRTIMISPVGEQEEGFDMIRLYLLGTCMAALLMQRGIYPLHGSALSMDGKVYALVGESGAGKSTLAAALLREGCSLLSDDLIALSFDEDKGIRVSPAYPQQKLWQESLAHLAMPVDDYKSVYGRMTKYRIPLNGQFLNTPQPLAGIVELVKNGAEEVSIRKIDGLERLPTLGRHTFRPFLIPPLGLAGWHFEASAQLAGRIDMFQLQRPESKVTVTELVRVFMDSVITGGVQRENQFHQHA
ncbi:aldolase [Paenibacillus aurantius]|uniref:Aldolase n=1 Tax=Paenibacillus aurantius TaxID=2918900 RepID=A0AA96LG97_9BACL|nr:aldolase [Paenibacillus aurantius]WNQ12679.1 aldolase [Paenibacillus aurantius]